MDILIEDLKKVMASDIEDKDKYLKALILGFVRERDSELLTIQGVVKSLNNKEEQTFEKWLSTFKKENNKYIVAGKVKCTKEEMEYLYNTQVKPTL